MFGFNFWIKELVECKKYKTSVVSKENVYETVFSRFSFLVFCFVYNLLSVGEMGK